MNNLSLGNYPLVKLSLSVLILMGVSAASKADTLYGPLKAGETLSSIVNENYLVSPFEDAVIMREIFRLNPQAFIANNMGLVKQGVMLTLPSDATMQRTRVPGSSSSTATAPAVVISTPVTSNTTSITRSLNETLTQVRNERDQANLKLKRLQAESDAQTDTLNAKIEQLDSDNQSTARQLNNAQAEITQLKQSLETTQKENTVLATKAQSVPVTADVSDELTKQLEQGELLLTEKQKQIAELETTVAQLKTQSEAINKSHDAALAQLQSEYKSLESKFEQQVQTATSEGNKSAADSTAKIDELNLQHQKAIADLNIDFDKKIADQTSLQQTLESDLKEAKATIESTGIELTGLQSKNGELELALSDSQAELENLASANSAAEVEVKPNVITLTQTDTIETLLEGPITKELLIKEMDKPVAFPLWGLLLGSFALGFTSLMMLFTRSRKPALQITQNTPIRQSDAPDKTEPVMAPVKEDLVFRAADENALHEPDIETLRVPPRRDPSRVAILDPSMVASAAVATSAVASSSTSAVNAEPEETIEETQLTSHQATEVKLKLISA